MAEQDKYLCVNGCGVIGAVLVNGKPLCWKCYLSPEDYRLRFELKGLVYRMPRGGPEYADAKMQKVPKDAGTQNR